MSSLRRAKQLQFVGLSVLLIGACKPTEVVSLAPHASRPKTHTSAPYSRPTSPGPLEDRTSSFIDEAQITDPIAFARRVVALSHGETTEEVEDFGTTYDPDPTAQGSGQPVTMQPPFQSLEPQQPHPLMQALQQARMRDFEDRENAKLAALNHQRLDLEDATEEPPQPRQITRFDRGLGMEIDYLVATPIVRTTGRSGPLPAEDELPRQCALMSQVIGNPNPPGRRSGFVDFPVQNQRSLSTPPPFENRPGCNDGRDNNANGLSDRDDPVCWSVPGDPGSYAPHFSESEPLNPFGSAALPSPVAPAASFSPTVPAMPASPAIPTPCTPSTPCAPPPAIDVAPGAAGPC